MTATIGDPATSLKDAMDSIATAIQTQIRTTDPAATVTSSVVGNKVRFSMSAATATHNIRFGATGDTSNALTIFGLSGAQNAAFANASRIDGVSLLGVVRATGTSIWQAWRISRPPRPACSRSTGWRSPTTRRPSR